MNKIKILDSAFREYLNRDMEIEDNFRNPQIVNTSERKQWKKKEKRKGIELLAYHSEMYEKKKKPYHCKM